MFRRTIKIPCDNNVDGDAEGLFLKIDADLFDYWVSIDGDPLNPFRSVRFCTSGARDSSVTLLISSLFHYMNGDLSQSAFCAELFAKNLRERK